MVNDVEKRFTDDGTFRRAASYVVAVLGIAAVVAAATALWAARAAVVFAPGAVLLLGGLGAFVITYLRWRDGKNWVIWQGAGWFLFVLMTVYFAIGGGTAGT
ncbi:hypothetical protein AB0H76_10220 [Nocardia sp. NPDC050712]|uniref:hypothetical protein n=1 Tax=Nocardia sp. NPDC050712 TaxID=3155518 RepID=UPI0033CE408A